MVRKTFESYRACKAWLETYEEQRDYFIQSLGGTTIPGICYEEKTGGSITTLDQRMASIADEISDYDKKWSRMKKHCEDVVNICDNWLTLVTPKNKEVIRLAFMEGNYTHSMIADGINYSRQMISHIIKQECELIDRLKD